MHFLTKLRDCMNQQYLYEDMRTCHKKYFHKIIALLDLQIYYSIIYAICGLEQRQFWKVTYLWPEVIAYSVEETIWW